MRLSFTKPAILLAATALGTFLLALTGCQTANPEAAFQDYEVTGWTAPTPTEESQPIVSTPQETPSTDLPNASTNPPSELSDVFRVGEVVGITYSGVTSEEIKPHQEQVKEDGTITPFLVGPIQAAGKTPGQLQRELQKRYNEYYKTLVVTVIPAQRFYYVGGEVKRPGAQQYLGMTTVTKAIQAAGDFTDFAKKNRIRVIRADGTALTVNFNKVLAKPKLDPPIYPGDKIHVPRRILF